MQGNTFLKLHQKPDYFEMNHGIVKIIGYSQLHLRKNINFFGQTT